MDECVAYLCERFGARVEEQTVRVENARFALPRELRQGPDPAIVPLPVAVPLGPAGPFPAVPAAPQVPQ